MTLRPTPSPRIEAIRAYKVPRHPAPVDLVLDGNEGLAPPLSLFGSLSSAGAELLRRYPSAASLEAQLAARLGVSPDQLIVTAGADDALDRACRALLSPGRELVLPVPTFEMIARYAGIVGAEIVEVPWGNTAYPREAVLAQVSEKTAAVVVVSPNNPTGRSASVEDIAALSAAAPGAVILLDLAYAEFGDDALCRAALALPNVVVFRTLSKAWGLAGLRVGYAAGPAEIVGWLRAAGAPYAVSAPSLLLASAWLLEGQEDMARFVEVIRAERASLSALLTELGAEVYESDANFVFARFQDALWVRDALAGVGIGVRAFPGKPGLSDALRISLPGDEAAFARLTEALRAALRPEVMLFDMDGVLADASGSYRRAIVETARSFGVDATAEQIAAIKRAGDANNDWIVTARVLAAAGVNPPFEDVKARFEALYQGEGTTPGLCETERLLCEVAWLEALAKRMPLGIVTGRPRKDASAFLERFGIAHLFSARVCMEDAPLKPNPAPVHLCLEQLGARRAWMFGDTPDDIRASRAAGVIPVGLVAPGDDPQRTCESLLSSGAARVFAALSEIDKVLP